MGRVTTCLEVYLLSLKKVGDLKELASLIIVSWPLFNMSWLLNGIRILSVQNLGLNSFRPHVAFYMGVYGVQGLAFKPSRCTLPFILIFLMLTHLICLPAYALEWGVSLIYIVTTSF